MKAKLLKIILLMVLWLCSLQVGLGVVPPPPDRVFETNVEGRLTVGIPSGESLALGRHVQEMTFFPGRVTGDQATVTAYLSSGKKDYSSLTIDYLTASQNSTNVEYLPNPPPAPLIGLDNLYEQRAQRILETLRPNASVLEEHARRLQSLIDVRSGTVTGITINERFTNDLYTLFKESEIGGRESKPMFDYKNIPVDDPENPELRFMLSLNMVILVNNLNSVIKTTESEEIHGRGKYTYQRFDISPKLNKSLPPNPSNENLSSWNPIGRVNGGPSLTSPSEQMVRTSIDYAYANAYKKWKDELRSAIDAYNRHNRAIAKYFAYLGDVAAYMADPIYVDIIVDEYDPTLGKMVKRNKGKSPAPYNGVRIPTPHGKDPELFKYNKGFAAYGRVFYSYKNGAMTFTSKPRVGMNEGATIEGPPLKDGDDDSMPRDIFLKGGTIIAGCNPNDPVPLLGDFGNGTTSGKSSVIIEGNIVRLGGSSVNTTVSSSPNVTLVESYADPKDLPPTDFPLEFMSIRN